MSGSDDPFGPGSNLFGGVNNPSGQQFLQAFQNLVLATNAMANAISGLTVIGQPASGDLSGTYPGPIDVEGIAGNSVTPAAWTPSDGSGAALVFTAVSANRTRLGNIMHAYASLTYPATANGSNAVIAGFPVAFPGQNYAGGPCVVFAAGAATAVMLVPIITTTTAKLLNPVGGAALTNANLSGLTLVFHMIYPVA